MYSGSKNDGDVPWKAMADLNLREGGYIRRINSPSFGLKSCKVVKLVSRIEQPYLQIDSGLQNASTAHSMPPFRPLEHHWGI